LFTWSSLRRIGKPFMLLASLVRVRRGSPRVLVTSISYVAVAVVVSWGQSSRRRLVGNLKTFISRSWKRRGRLCDLPVLHTLKGVHGKLSEEQRWSLSGGFLPSLFSV
jgi:hypothetical protein